MRNIEEIKADITTAIRNSDYTLADELTREQRQVITAGINADRLAELCTAEREGRVVVLPCKVGQLVWYNIKDAGSKCDLDCPDDFCGEVDSEDCQHCEKAEWNTYMRRFDMDMINEIGKTVFLNPGEAEAALAGMEAAE